MSLDLLGVAFLVLCNSFAKCFYVTRLLNASEEDFAKLDSPSEGQKVLSLVYVQ